jgi:hypothetical protein
VNRHVADSCNLGDLPLRVSCVEQFRYERFASFTCSGQQALMVGNFRSSLYETTSCSFISDGWSLTN